MGTVKASQLGQVKSMVSQLRRTGIYVATSMSQPHIEDDIIVPSSPRTALSANAASQFCSSCQSVAPAVAVDRAVLK